MPAGSYDRYYRILDLEPGSSLAEVQDAWRLLSQIWHPDRQQPGSRAYQKALEKQKQINDAYDRLKAVLPNEKQSPPPHTPPPDNGGQGAPPNWQWPPPPGSGTTSEKQSDGQSQWQQSPFAQAIGEKFIPLFDLGQYRGQAVYDSVTGMLDYVPASRWETLRQYGYGCFLYLLSSLLIFGGAYYFELFTGSLPAAYSNLGMLVIPWFFAWLFLNVWATWQVYIYRATLRPLLELYHVDKGEALEIITKTLSEYSAKDYNFGPIKIEQLGEVSILKTEVFGKDANKQAKLIWQGEIYPLSNASLIRFKIIVQSPGKEGKLAELYGDVFRLLAARLKQAGKDNLKNKGASAN